MISKEMYNYWLNYDGLLDSEKEELIKIKDDEKEIEERFYRDLEFGTGGLRGIIGTGTNRMNKYIVRKATQGLANYIIDCKGEARGVAISYDSRYFSDLFALECAKVLAANGIKAYLSDELRPTPVLSFMVRELNAIAGIMITASHNPAKYNGYKAYWDDGGQLPPESASVVLDYMNKIDVFKDVKVMEEKEAREKGLIMTVSGEIDDKFLAKVKEQAINPDVIKKVAEEFKVVYTPFHGAGNKPVRKILDMAGVKNVLIVKEQELPDPAFSTVKSPNPEEKEGFSYAIKLAKENNADLIIGTDPDADRIGVLVRNEKGEYLVLTGNQVGILLTEYILSQRKLKGTLPKNGAVIKTIVTSELVRAITEEYGLKIMDVLTGFKFIGEKIKEFEDNNSYEYVFGFEESYGYLAGTYARDKDSIVASMLVCEMTAYYKTLNKSLYDALMDIYSKYGFYTETLTSTTLEGKEGIQEMNSIMQSLRSNPIKEIAGINAVAIRDYKTGKRTNLIDNTISDIDLPESNVLYFEMEDKSWFVIRPSGTEPKIKLYFSCIGSSIEDGLEKVSNMEKNLKEYIRLCKRR